MDKKEKIYICIPTLLKYDLCLKVIESAEKSTVKPDKYIIIDNGGGLEFFLKKINFDLSKIEIISFNRNLGVSASWNYFLKNYEGIKLIVNDDIVFDSNTIEKLLELYYTEKDNSSVGMISVWGINCDSCFSCFILKDICLKTVGYFDENFYPAYYEDCDYKYRMDLSKLQISFSTECSYSHFGSATFKSYTDKQMEQHHATFAKNKEYYIKKWGGDRFQETFKIPFNDTKN